MSLVLEDEVGGICLGIPSRRYVVAVSAALAVVDTGKVIRTRV